MKTVSVCTPSKKYDVCIGSGLLGAAGNLALTAGIKARAAVITDSNVDALYANALIASLNEAGIMTLKYVFEAGESSKNTHTLAEGLNFLGENRLTRADAVFALGGGVTGDLAGLCAALYMRGIKSVQVPTTLLAAVDSSVGGKTAVDLKAGKNLVGTFYQPDLVICDIGTFTTLPESEIANGFAEVIKYGVIRDAALLDNSVLRSAPNEEIVARCVEIKSEIVAADERDAGERQLLNFGHTFGHAVECASAYTVAHGSAVAAGMVIMTAACVKKNICGESCLHALKNALAARGLLFRTPYDADALFSAVLSDKKRAADTITLIVVRALGFCERRTVPLSEAKEMLALGLEYMQ